MKIEFLCVFDGKLHDNFGHQLWRIIAWATKLGCLSAYRSHLIPLLLDLPSVNEFTFNYVIGRGGFGRVSSFASATYLSVWGDWLTDYGGGSGMEGWASQDEADVRNEGDVQGEVSSNSPFQLISKLLTCLVVFLDRIITKKSVSSVMNER